MLKIFNARLKYFGFFFGKVKFLYNRKNVILKIDCIISISKIILFLSI